jgi:cytochrome P450
VSELPSYNPTIPGYFADPYPHYAQLRDENPVHLTRFGFWLVTRYTDVVAGYRHPQLSRDTTRWQHFAEWRRGSADGPLERMMANWLVMMDPPRHTAVRAIHELAFPPARFTAAEPVVEKLVAELLAPMVAAGGGDLVADFAERLPVFLINHLLGVPRADWEPFVGWSRAIALTSEAQLTRKVLQAGVEAQAAMYEYFDALVAQRRRSPGDDLLSALARTEVDNVGLDPDELRDSLVFLYQAGHPTSTQLITLAVHSLLRHPAVLAGLRENPATVPAAVGELQRYDGPVQMNDRVALADLDLFGQRIGEGDLVRLCLASANRDPQRFAQPDRLDPSRDTSGALGYGHGIHHCVGAALGRIQATAALIALVDPALEMRHGEGKLRFLPSTSNRGLLALPVEF